jgi:uncharacterized protein YfeS
MFDHPHYKAAHPDAKKLMDEPFYFSPIEESAPFGSDDGSDAFMDFEQWRPSNPEKSPLRFLEELLDRWGYPPFNLLELDQSVIDSYTSGHALHIGMLVGMDAAIIGVAFGQLYLEGIIDPGLNELALTAIRRQLHPELLQRWDADYAPVREEQLIKMMGVLTRVAD